MATILFVDTVDMSCWRILILQQSGAILSISAAFVKTTMTYLSPRAMVATGPLGEISQSFSGGIHTTTALAPELMRSPGRGKPGLLRFATRVRGDIANPSYGIKPFIIKQPEIGHTANWVDPVSYGRHVASTQPG